MKPTYNTIIFFEGIEFWPKINLILYLSLKILKTHLTIIAFGLVKKAYQSMTWPKIFQRSLFFLSNLDHQSLVICLFESKQFVHCVVKRWQYIVVTSLDNETATKKKKKSTMGAVQFFFLNSHISFYIVAYLGLASCWVLSHQEDTGFLYPSRVPIEYAGCNGGKSFSTQAANDQQ